MTDQLSWPPKKEDLERLYLVQRLSGAKIAKVYGLNYASPKTAESTILHHLKKNGIRRRDKAEHVRKITGEMVDIWVRRYQHGESLKQIAGGDVNPVSVWNHLHARGLRLRDKVEAQIKAVSKYQKTRFLGDLNEKAYLLGLGWGDLHVSRHGRAIRAKTSTTHPAMIELVESCFDPYGKVTVSPRNSSLAGFEWAVQVDLDQTFEFLLEKYGPLPKWVTRDAELFRSFLAGLFDAEGSIFLHEARSEFEISISNEDSSLLRQVFQQMTTLGYDCRLVKIKNSDLWRIYMWNREHVERFLRTIPTRHGEKRAKASLSLSIQAEKDPSRRAQLFEMWDRLRANIKQDRDRYVDDARRQFLAKGRKDGI